MKRMLRVSSALAVVLLALSSVAAGVVPGEWYYYFRDSLTYSQEHGLPMVMVWENLGCTNCEALDRELYGTEFKSWAAGAGRNYVLCQVKGSGGVDYDYNAGAKYFAQTANGLNPEGLDEYPFVCLYMPYEGGMVFCATNFTGISGRMIGSVRSGTLAAQLISSIEAFMASLQPPDPHVEFPMGDTDNDRLEVVAGRTEWVDVPLRRTAGTNLTASVNLALADPGGDPLAASNVLWQAGETFKTVRFDLPSGLEVGDRLTVTLANHAGTALAARPIVCVGEGENTPKNPLWIGERTADTLKWGEWTMDLDIVTNKVAAFNAANPAPGAYALVIVGGSCWCPDCVMTDAHFLDRPEFTAWARTNRIALGVVDIPNNPTAEDAFPSLLTYTSSRASDAYISMRGTCEPDERQRYQSGAGYLSRHSVPRGAADDVIVRNRNLCSHNTLNGGWNRPERANQSRPGVPILLLLREDGSIAGRFDAFATTAPTAFNAAYLKRLEELLLQTEMREEEENDHQLTTSETISTGEGVTATISATDAQDVYRIVAPRYTRASFTLTGEADAEVVVEVTDDEGAVSRSLASTSASLRDGVSLEAKLPSESCNLRISFNKNAGAYATTGYFALTNLSSTVCGYRLDMDSVMSGGEIGFGSAVMETEEGKETFRMPVLRRFGTNGAARVTVSLVRTPAAVAALEAGRIVWPADQTLAWTGRSDDPLEKFAEIGIVRDYEFLDDLVLEFRLTEFQGDAPDACIDSERSSALLVVHDADGLSTVLRRHVAADAKVAVTGFQPGDEIVVDKISGSLPGGVVVGSADGYVTLTGVPKVRGDFKVSYRVSVYRNGNPVATQDVDFDLAVRDGDAGFIAAIPSLSETRTYSNLPIVRDGRLCALLSVTVPVSGRLSAKLIDAGRAHGFDCAGWSSFSVTNRTITATLNPDANSPLAPIEVVLTDSELAIGGADFSLSVPSVGWSPASPAAAWSGQYTVQMPQTNVCDVVSNMTGDAYMAMRMITDTAIGNGYMIYAGVMPNGRAFSGASVLLDNGDGTVTMPMLFSEPDPHYGYGIAGAVDIRSNPQEILWSVSASGLAKPVWWQSGKYEHTAELLVYGGYYDSSTVYDRFVEDYKQRASSFALRAEDLTVPATMEPSGPKLSSTENATLEFHPVTGVVSGLIACGDAFVPYRGIILPGWQICEECVLDVVERPWAAGSAAFNDWSSGSMLRDGFQVRMDCEK